MVRAQPVHKAVAGSILQTEMQGEGTDVAAGEMVTGEVIRKFSHAAPVRTRMSL